MQQYSDEYKSSSKRFLFRFLKEHKIYNKFQDYIHNKSTWNFYQRRCNGDFTIDQAVNDKSYYLYSNSKEYYIGLLSYLIVWRKTEEGYGFWYKKHNQLLQEWRNYVREMNENKKW